MQQTDLDVRKPFTRATAVAAGITDAMLRGPGFRQLFRGVYVHSAVRPTSVLYLEAALLLHPDSAFASHHSSALLHGLPVPESHLAHVSALTKADRRPRSGIRCHLAPPDPTVVTARGLRASSPVQLFLELATDLSLVDLVVLGDAMVRRGLVAPEDLVRAASRARGRSASLALRAARYVRTRVDSPMETRLRMLLVLAGFPEPVVNLEVLCDDRTVMYRFDLAFPEHKVVVEYDGGQHREDRAQWSRDITRDEWVNRAGWTLVRVIASGVYRRPDDTLARVRRALLDSGCRDLPRVLSDEWRAYFPVRG